MHVFPRGHVERVRHEIEGTAVCEIVGRSHDDQGNGTPAEFEPSDKDLVSIAVVHADWSGHDLRDLGIDYWALGGNSARSTPLQITHDVAHYPGSPQGRTLHQTGPHGCTLVSVSDVGEFTLSPIGVRCRSLACTTRYTACARQSEAILNCCFASAPAQFSMNRIARR